MIILRGYKSGDRTFAILESHVPPLPTPTSRRTSHRILRDRNSGRWGERHVHATILGYSLDALIDGGSPISGNPNEGRAERLPRDPRNSYRARRVRAILIYQGLIPTKRDIKLQRIVREVFLDGPILTPGVTLTTDSRQPSRGFEELS